jgi:transposase InsO family protein
MTQKVVTMETKLQAVFAAGLSMPVTQLCAELRISRQTFYKYKRRWDEEGPPGLVERSRRPHRSPGMMSTAVENEIVRLRKELPLDKGAQSIAYHLHRAGWPVPSVASIHRALVRRGMVIPQPHKRPRSAWRRFEWPRPNEAWQIDATRWVLRGGREVWVMDVLDDHSRLLVAARACGGPTGEAAWDAICDGAQRWGLPAHVMSDNGTCFTNRFQGWSGETAFERDLRALGVSHIRSRPGHPQTCGKLERFHQTLKKWLAAQPLARSQHQLQAQLDVFAEFYNHQRPHRALSGHTPAERWSQTSPASPGEPIPAAPNAGLHLVSPSGSFSWGTYTIGVGSQYARHQLLVIARDDDLAVFGPDGLIRRLRLDRSRRYQPTGNPKGRRSKPTTAHHGR